MSSDPLPSCAFPKGCWPGQALSPGQTLSPGFGAPGQLVSPAYSNPDYLASSQPHYWLDAACARPPHSAFASR